jgi:hypothetical protein
LEFHHPGYRTPIVTSPIQEINEQPPLVHEIADHSLANN